MLNFKNSPLFLFSLFASLSAGAGKNSPCSKVFQLIKEIEGKEFKELQEPMSHAGILALMNVDEGGGPFGAVITKDQKIISAGVNRVTSSKDPTAHAEVNAIRNAAQNIKNHNLSGYEIFSSAEPCPMCLGAIQWANISKIYFSNPKKYTTDIGFDDEAFYKENKISMEELPDEWAGRAFERWREKPDKELY